MNTSPYPHQVELLLKIRDALRAGDRRIIAQAPTGFGKTLVAAMITEGALAKSNCVIFCCAQQVLIDKTVDDFRREGIDAVGVMQGNHPMEDGSKPVQVCTIQTIAARGKPRAAVVLIDEVHVWFREYEAWMNDPDWADVPFIGLSATPWRKGLGKFFQRLIVVRTMQELIDQEYLTPIRTFAPAHPDLKGVGTSSGPDGRDFNRRDLSSAMNKPNLVADVVEQWLRRGENRPTLCFAVDRAHATKLKLQFEAAGVPVGYIDYTTKPLDRTEVLRQFRSGEIKIICNVATLTTGVDEDVRAIILARPTKSKMLFVQMVGRGVRPAPGKTDCIVLDHSDTTLRLGLPTDIVQEHLDDGKGRGPAAERKVEAALPKECPSCSFLKPAKVPICPSCGFKPERQSKVAVDDGDLVELRPKDKRTKQFSAVERWELYGQLKHYGYSRNFKPGWATRQFVEMTKVWPDGVEHAPMIPPTPAVANLIKARMIRYAKGRASAHGRVSHGR